MVTITTYENNFVIRLVTVSACIYPLL